MKKEIKVLSLHKLLFNETKILWIWLLVNIYVGWAWISSVLGKVNAEPWAGTGKWQPVSVFIKSLLG